MKYFKMAGLCLASMFVMSMSLASTASALKWEGCLEKAAGTKYNEINCAEAEAGGEWGWGEFKNTDLVLGVGFTFKLTDTKVPIIGSTSAICTEGGRIEGTVGPGEYGRIEEAKVISAAADCRGTGGCKAAGIKAVNAVDLPWQTKLSEEKGRFLQAIENGGNGEPGWEVECENILNGTTKDVCKSESVEKLENVILTNRLTPEFKKIGRNVQLVLATFAKTRKAKCTSGGAESGEIEGTGAILLANEKLEPSKKGLRVH